MIDQLDLGGTADLTEENGVGISDDGTGETLQFVIGDYNASPFPDNTFVYASGGCYLEDTPNFEELFRILKPGGTAWLRSCGSWYAPVVTVRRDMIAAGFEIVEWNESYYTQEMGNQSDGGVTIRKPKEA